MGMYKSKEVQEAIWRMCQVPNDTRWLSAVAKPSAKICFGHDVGISGFRTELELFISGIKGYLFMHFERIGRHGDRKSPQFVSAKHVYSTHYLISTSVFLFYKNFSDNLAFWVSTKRKRESRTNFDRRAKTPQGYIRRGLGRINTSADCWLKVNAGFIAQPRKTRHS